LKLTAENELQQARRCMLKSILLSAIVYAQKGKWSEVCSMDPLFAVLGKPEIEKVTKFDVK
jgi:hypothetical protein